MTSEHRATWAQRREMDSMVHFQLKDLLKNQLRSRNRLLSEFLGTARLWKWLVPCQVSLRTVTLLSTGKFQQTGCQPLRVAPTI